MKQQQQQQQKQHKMLISDNFKISKLKILQGCTPGPT